MSEDEYKLITSSASHRFKYRLANWMAHGYEFKAVTGVLVEREGRTIAIDQAGFDFEVAEDHIEFHSSKLTSRVAELEAAIFQYKANPTTGNQHEMFDLLKESE